MAKEYCFEKTDFDYTNPNAEVVIVGITPGNNQLLGSREGKTLKEIKRENAFGGNMRPNLIAMLDHIGVNRLLGIESCRSFWEEDFDRVEMTSLLKDATYVVKKNGEKEMFKNCTAITSDEALNRRFRDGFVEDCRHYSNVRLFIACGAGVYDILFQLQKEGLIQAPIAGIVHPSGANSGRIATFLGRREPKEGEVSYQWAQKQGLTRVIK